MVTLELTQYFDANELKYCVRFNILFLWRTEVLPGLRIQTEESRIFMPDGQHWQRIGSCTSGILHSFTYTLLTQNIYMYTQRVH